MKVEITREELAAIKELRQMYYKSYKITEKQKKKYEWFARCPFCFTAQDHCFQCVWWKFENKLCPPSICDKKYSTDRYDEGIERLNRWIKRAVVID